MNIETENDSIYLFNQKIIILNYKEQDNTYHLSILSKKELLLIIL